MPAAQERLAVTGQEHAGLLVEGQRHARAEVEVCVDLARRVTVGFPGGAQIDRFAKLNTTVIGPYSEPKVSLPGGGGAPEIASNS
jgi:acyl CoA:acetate/3-ketoacid CoA transferase beta subunit